MHFSMLVIGVSFACYAPSLDSLQDQAYRSAVVIEGEVSSLPENVSVEPYSVNVKVLDVWPVNSGGLEREQLVTVGEFGSEAPCVAVEKHHRYIFFMDPTEEPLVFKASFAPLDSTSEKTLKKDVESVLCEDCGKFIHCDCDWWQMRGALHCLTGNGIAFTVNVMFCSRGEREDGSLVFGRLCSIVLITVINI